MSSWLLLQGARIIGISDNYRTTPSVFEALSLEERISHNETDIRDQESVMQIVHSEKPEFIFHLAAQSIVSTSYSEPLKTISTNVLGTASLLESLRNVDWECNVIVVTSDKCYENVEWTWGYRENDRLGGKDIYSASKAAAELVIRSYSESFFLNDRTSVKLAIARAGNVIGGGDWSPDRVVADTFRAWSQKETVVLRSPQAIRPWQHVLEPLSGYLSLAIKLAANEIMNAEPFNFGPRVEDIATVKELIDELSVYWHFDKGFQPSKIDETNRFHEAGILKLNCDKAFDLLDWKPTLNFSQMSKMVSDWYAAFYSSQEDMTQFTTRQIQSYISKAEEIHQSWAQE